MQAIVLARRDFREADQVVSLYTKEKGKVELLARGVKKIVSKNSAHLEPGCINIVDMVHGKRIDHLTKVQSITFLKNVRADVGKTLATGVVARLTNQLIEVGHPDTRIFSILASWLRFVEKSVVMNWLLVDAYALQLFALLGLQPVLAHCVVCEKTLRDMIQEDLTSEEHRRPGMYFAGGGLICWSCRDEKEKIGEDIMPAGLKEISDLQLLLHGDWRAIHDFSFSEREKQRLHTLTFAFLTYHSEKKIVDWNFPIS